MLKNYGRDNFPIQTLIIALLRKGSAALKGRIFLIFYSAWDTSGKIEEIKKLAKNVSVLLSDARRLLARVIEKPGFYCIINH